MCSVVGCDSWRRSAQCFSLPEDPERRLQWVQFVAEDDEQLLKESSWTDIVICREHFLVACFEKPVETDRVQLKPSAVPSVRIKSEVGEFVDSLLLEEPLKTEGGFGQYDTVPTLTEQTLYKEKVDPLLVQEKHLMNENDLFELFPHKCPSCHGKLQTKKLNEGTLITLTQQCLLCEYQNEYKKQITASTTEHQSSTGSTEVEPDPTDEKHSNSETPVPCKEESYLPAEEEGGGNRGVTSAEDWFPIKKPVPIKEEDIEENAKEVPNNGDTPPSVCQSTKLPCNECGYLYHTDMAHIVEHKPDPTDDKHSNSDTLVPCKEESDVPDEDERGGDGDGSSSEDWFPIQNRRKAVTIEPDPADKHSYSQTSDSSDEEEGGEDVTSEEDWKPVLAEQEVTKKVRNYVDLPTSVRRSTKQLCNECGYFYNTDRAHICEHKLKPYACNVCGKRCFTKTSLKLHCLIHDDSKVHACKYCYAPFKTKQAKLDHQETHEDTPYPFQCPDCPATFACFLERREHLRTHTKPKEHKCDKCGITFRRRYVLHRHMVVHTGVKPYKCSVCERSFNQPGHLKSHLRLHTGEKPYKCQHCDKSFNHNVSLKSHMQRYHHNERSNNTDDAPDSNDSESDFCNDNEEKEQNTEEGGEDSVVMAKPSKLLTGRPRGRPKRNDEGKLALRGKRKGLKKGGKSKLNQHHRNEESEDELTDLSFDLEQEEEKKGRRKVSRKCSSQLENTNDYDCDSKVIKKKRSWRRGLRKGRGKAKTK